MFFLHVHRLFVLLLTLLLLLVFSISAKADPVDGHTAAFPPLTVLALFRDRALLELGGQQRLLSVGEKFGGVALVASSSREAVLEYRGVRRRLSLNQRIGGGKGSQAKPQLTVWPDSRGMYLTAGTINGFPVNFLVDTGATSVALSGREAKRLGIDYRLVGDSTQVATASEVVKGYRVVLNQVSVGEITLRNIEAVVIEGDQPDPILLGMSYLKRIDISHHQGAMLMVPKY